MNVVFLVKMINVIIWYNKAVSCGLGQVWWSGAYYSFIQIKWFYFNHEFCFIYFQSRKKHQYIMISLFCSKTSKQPIKNKDDIPKKRSALKWWEKCRENRKLKKEIKKVTKMIGSMLGQNQVKSNDVKSCTYCSYVRYTTL